MITDRPVNLACKVIKSFRVYEMDVFIGEVIETYVNADCITNGNADTKKINPLIYCMDQLYWDIGKIVGKIGKNYKKL